MVTQQYDSLADALEVAGDNQAARKELAQQGWGHVVLAEVWNVDGKYEIRSVTVRPESSWQTAPQQFIVRMFEFGSLRCPACDRMGRVVDEGRIGSAIINRVAGLDPATCGACHDLMTHNGISPTDWSVTPPKSIPRP